MPEHRCGNCGTLMQYPDNMAGSAASCPKCGAQILLAAATRTAATPVGPDPAGSAPLGSSPASTRLSQLRASRSSPVVKVSLVLSLLALGGSLASVLLMLFWFKSVPGRGLGGYDLSAPRAAVRALMEMDANADFAAKMELAQILQRRDREDELRKVDSLQVEKVLEWEGKSVVLYHYFARNRDKGKDTDIYVAHWMEKQEGRWVPATVDTSGWRSKGGEQEAIAKEIGDWLSKDDRYPRRTQYPVAAPRFVAPPRPAPAPGPSR